MASYDTDNLAHRGLTQADLRSVAVPEQEEYARWLLRLIAIAKATRRARFVVLEGKAA